MQVSSPAFKAGGAIPARFTCKGADVSPELRVEGMPPEAKAWALIVDDPDAPAGLWTHWTVWDIPAGLASLPEGWKPSSARAVEGLTSMRHTGYHGPCPPRGTHRYFFRAYACAAPLGLKEGASRADLDKALRRGVLAQAELMGTFSK